MSAKSAYDEWSDEQHATHRPSLSLDTHRLIRANLGYDASDAQERACRRIDETIVALPDGFGAIARILVRLSDRLTRIEARLGLLEASDDGE